MVEIFVTVRVIPFPLLQPSRFVFPAFPELAGLPPGHASVGFFGVTAIRPSSGVKPEMSSVRVRRRRGSSFGEVSGAHHLVYESSYENDCPRKVPTCKAHGESRARGNAPNTCNTPPRREASPTEPQVCSMTASPRFCARRRLTGLRWRRARRHSPLNGPERAAVRASDRLDEHSGMFAPAIAATDHRESPETVAPPRLVSIHGCLVDRAPCGPS